MVTIIEVASFLHAEDALLQFHEGSSNVVIHGPAPVTSAGSGEVSFCGKTAKDPLQLISQTHASLLIVDKSIAVEKNTLSHSDVHAIIISDNARLDFIRLVEKFFSPKKPTGIHPTAVISPDAVIASDVYIGPFTYVGKCKIGERTVIYGHVYIYDNIRIGRNVIIHAGTVIGADGFGYYRNEMGELEKFPHIGGVVIEDNVEIGSNTSIDRGTLGNTVIQKGAKIDNLVHIAHNVVIGKHTAVIAHAMIGGSTRVGRFSWIAPCACLRDAIAIGDKATAGLGSVVVKDVPDNVTVIGVPAKPVEE